MSPSSLQSRDECRPLLMRTSKMKLIPLSLLFSTSSWQLPTPPNAPCYKTASKWSCKLSIKTTMTSNFSQQALWQSWQQNCSTPVSSPPPSWPWPPTLLVCPVMILVTKLYPRLTLSPLVKTPCMLYTKFGPSTCSPPTPSSDDQLTLLCSVCSDDSVYVRSPTGN